jgi:hypothetical protein
MKTFRQTAFAICAVACLMSTHAAALEPIVPPLKTLQPYPASAGGVVQLRDRRDIVMPAPYRYRQCRISGARAQRIERYTSNPCLAADSVPGGICFERLGQNPQANPSALLNSWDAPC